MQASSRSMFIDPEINQSVLSEIMTPSASSSVTGAVLP